MARLTLHHLCELTKFEFWQGSLWRDFSFFALSIHELLLLSNRKFAVNLRRISSRLQTLLCRNSASNFGNLICCLLPPLTVAKLHFILLWLSQLRVYSAQCQNHWKIVSNCTVSELLENCVECGCKIHLIFLDRWTFVCLIFCLLSPSGCIGHILLVDCSRQGVSAAVLKSGLPKWNHQVLMSPPLRKWSTSSTVGTPPKQRIDFGLSIEPNHGSAES